MSDRILILMDDLELAVQLNPALEDAGFRTVMVSTFDDTKGAVRKENPDLVILTGALHEPRVQHVIQAAQDQGIPTIGLIDAALGQKVEDLGMLGAQLGLKAVMRKPSDVGEIVAAARRVIERARIQERTNIIGNSPAVQEVLVKLEQMAPVTSTVLIEGESGTGKELVARAVHDLSPRRERPFIAVNCAALPENLLESELFGHEKGAFTGAAERRLGRFELANRGTIFLDEIGEVPPSTQVKLLRVLEERAFFRVGGTAKIGVDVRVIAATNRSLKEAVALGDFRDDLFYRLNVLSIYLPPLRERRVDIPMLVHRFIREFAQQHDREFRGITPEALRILVDAHWPGNVRQLRNLIESMVVLAPGEEIQARDIPAEVRSGGHAMLPVRIDRPAQDMQGRELEFILNSLVELKLQVEELKRRIEEVPAHAEVIEIPPRPGIQVLPGASGDEGHTEPDREGEIVYRPGMRMDDVERAVIEAVLRETGGNRRRAAETLGIGERTLYRKIKAFEIG